ncbi:aminotransferase class V-fold PLP-dependent enzyme [Bacteroides heparinolyticus]|uniref:Probable cysteine desulfurase n=7 Tax=Prevotella heparinolytica TaxID=28113 RepID=A0A449I6J7_9BACE|nr:cysteine desulfurase [Bacteroides heparinolyticus]MCI6213105.1 cysteine desulfurase [Bacteroides heparinolyticus]VFB15051.1 cysteine desulfurase [Bacteroides heparinolyticus]
MYDIQKIRTDFPILSREVYGKPLVYLDNGATTQKPRMVVDAISDEYYSVNANVHRGVHFLSQQATELHEASRETVRKFVNARSTNEIVFTRGTTESINLLVSCFGEEFMQEGDEVIISVMEHHSNIVPWQLLAAKKGIAIKVIPMNDKGELLQDEYRNLFSERTKIASFAHVSNVLGTVNPVKEMIAFAHEQGVPVMIDGAQSIPHMPVDVQELDADFFVFSGHKVYGPTGVGVLYGKEEWLDKLPPYQGGGEMIQSVSFEKTTFNELPFKFEAGTPDYIGTTGLAKALDYVSLIGMDKIAAYEHELTLYGMQRLKEVPGMRIFGEAEEKGSVISFLVGDIHHFDMGTLLDRLGIAVRTGHHCAQPLMQRLGIEGTVRASFGLYNTREEIDTLVAGIERVCRMF